MNRLRALDGLRGLAALGIVVWHWYFLFPDDAVQQGWTAEREPLFWLLRPLYLEGWAAVDLFFTLSGFVFFWLYGEAIRSRAMGGLRFGLLRFSRLYPLHLVTLLTVAVLQLWFVRATGHSFIFDANDAPHFAVQLFMAQNWWPRSVSSFNGVNWSVSIEVLLYIVFFFSCRAGLKGGGQCLVIALLGGVLLPAEEHIARGLIGFFMGGSAFALWEKYKYDPRAARLAGGAALAGWALLWLLLYRRTGWFAGGEGNNRFILPFDFLLCPMTVLALALREHQQGAAHAVFAFLGDISYAVYMLHFPMLLGLALVGGHFGVTTGFYMQGWVMALFFAGLIGLGTLVHYRFERPMQQIIRGGLARRRAARA